MGGQVTTVKLPGLPVLFGALLLLLCFLVSDKGCLYKTGTGNPDCVGIENPEV